MEKKEKIRIHFLGASGTVTGSKFLIDTGVHKIMIDCGLFQGLKELRLKNWDFPPFKPSEIDMVLLTHGHLDHVGYLPRLVKQGFKGSVLGTKPTLEIAGIIMRDSGKIQEEEAERANKEKYSKHDPAEPLYTLDEANRAIEHFKSVDEGQWLVIFPEIKVRFQYNGHIIGATFIELHINGEKFVFSGDIGRSEDVLMSPPKKPIEADYLFIESTYGNRIHAKDDLLERLKNIVNDALLNKGTLIIPSFAVERTQSLMYLLWQLKVKGLIPNVSMVMDSPMGANVLEVFKNNREWHKLPLGDCIEMCNSFRIIKEYKETWEVIDDNRSKIIIAGSGMITGGRVLTYLKYYIGKPNTTLLLAGFQAEGTRGRKLLEGVKSLKLYGEYYPVEAKVSNLQVLSSHADQHELIDWMSDIEKTPKKIFIIHGEQDAAMSLGDKIKEQYQWESEIPVLYSIVEV